MRSRCSFRRPGLWPVAGAWLAIAAVGCGGRTPAGEKNAVAGPPTVDVVRVVERPVDVNLEMPGELDPYEAVAVFPKVTGFVRTISVDRGSHVRKGELMAVLEAPELLAQQALSDDAIEKLIAERTQAKKIRNFGRADQIRNQLAEAGVIIEDSKDGVRWKRK